MLAKSEDGNTYKVTISNLAAGQAFTPPILLTHSKDTGIFTVGDPASDEIQALAENGNGAPLQMALGRATAEEKCKTGLCTGIIPMKQKVAAGPRHQ